MRPEVNSNRFEISDHFEILFPLHGNLHKDLMLKRVPNYSFYLMQA